VNSKTKEKPWSKRWPGTYAFKASFVTAKGSRVGIEANAKEERMGETVVALLLACATNTSSPKLLSLCDEVNQEIARLRDEKLLERERPGSTR
jgi:hypothetical protein